MQSAGVVAQEEFRGLLSRARVFVAAPRREDYGVAALEALACGCLLVTTPSPGPYPALDLARELDPRLVSDDLPGAIRTALDDPRPGYASARPSSLSRSPAPPSTERWRERVLPRLLS